MESHFITIIIELGDSEITTTLEIHARQFAENILQIVITFFLYIKDDIFR